MILQCVKLDLVLILIVVEDGLVQAGSFFFVCGDTGLNPYCSGRWSRTAVSPLVIWRENGLNPYCSGRWSRTRVPTNYNFLNFYCLNPYCSGRWSRTRPYKTLLIINKLKNFAKQIFTFLNRKLTIS